jgi:chromosomal replication initiation ATPase DnaA
MLDEQQPRAFASILTLQEKDGPSLHEIMDATMRNCMVGRKDFVSNRRAEQYCKARHIYSWLARKLTNKSWQQIAIPCGRDHSTVIHGYQSVERDPGRYEPELSRVRDAIGVERG